jgi:predicted transcriptional regulator
MDLGDKVLLGLAAFYLVSVLLTYAITKWKANRQLDGYNSLASALLGIEEKLSTKEEELTSKQVEVTKVEAKLEEINQQTKALQQLQAREVDLSVSVDSLMRKAKAVNTMIKELVERKGDRTKELNAVMEKLDLYTEIEGFVDHGHFEMPEYLFETSERFAAEIKIARDAQKSLIKSKEAVTYPAKTVISNDASTNKKVLGAQAKLMLTAFNIECDTLIGKVKPSTFQATLERIDKLATRLEKSSGSLACGFNDEYIRLKLDECLLQYQFTLKKQEEVEEQRAIREQIREEQKAIKEYEKAVAAAVKEEKMYRELLARAREELQAVTEDERSVAEARIAELELQLSEAEATEARAKSMAEQTRKGHVYVISNVGSFGRDIYKIGLTRRLDPMDRVKELGDASVPFTFDVHAMIYVDDAPTLEKELHREFTRERVNLVNNRKEFFNVSLDQVQKAVSKISGIDAEFKTTIAAEEYFESERLRGETA